MWLALLLPFLPSVCLFCIFPREGGERALLYTMHAPTWPWSFSMVPSPIPWSLSMVHPAPTHCVPLSCPLSKACLSMSAALLRSTYLLPSASVPSRAVLLLPCSPCAYLPPRAFPPPLPCKPPPVWGENPGLTPPTPPPSQYRPDDLTCQIVLPC